MKSVEAPTTIELTNSLHELTPSIKNASTLNAFKNRLDLLEKFQSLWNTMSNFARVEYP
jgi:hypothetical protein